MYIFFYGEAAVHCRRRGHSKGNICSLAIEKEVSH